MNFYKERDNFGMDQVNSENVSNPFESIPIIQKLYPNIQQPQNENKQHVEMSYFQQNMNSNTNSNLNIQIRNDQFARNTNFPVSNYPKPKQRHNIPVRLQSERKTDNPVPNTFTKQHDLTSPLNLKTAGSLSGDNLFKNEDNSCTTGLMTGIVSTPRDLLQENFRQNNGGPINLTNEDNNIKESENKIIIIDLDKNTEEHIKIFEDSLKTILELSKENQPLIAETYASSIANIEKSVNDSKEIINYKFLVITKTISQILQTIANTVTKSVQQMYGHKETQTGNESGKEYKDIKIASLDVKNTKTYSDNVVNSLPLKQHQQQQQNYSGFQQHQNMQTQPLPTNEGFRDSNRLTSSPSILKSTLETPNYAKQKQYGNTNEHRHCQTNCNRINNITEENIQFRGNKIQGTSRIEQKIFQDNAPIEFQKNDINDNKSYNNISHNFGEVFDTTDKQHSEEYLRQQMVNSTISQKRKIVYTACEPTDCVPNTKPIKHNIPIPELPKRPRYEKMQYPIPPSSEPLNLHKIAIGSVLTGRTKPNDIADELDFILLPNKKINEMTHKEKTLIDCVNLDDDDENLTINNESYKALQALSQMNKKMLMKKINNIDIKSLEQSIGKEKEVNNVENVTKMVVQIFQTIIEKLADTYKTKKLQLDNQIHRSTQTEMPNEIKSVVSPQTPITNVSGVQNPFKNPKCNVTYGENKDVNNWHPQLNHLLSSHPDYDAFKQYQHVSHPNQAYLTQNREKQPILKPSILKLGYQEEPRFSQESVMDPTGQLRSYRPQNANTRLISMPQTSSHPQQVSDMTKNWNIGQNEQHINDLRQNMEYQQYQNQMDQKRITEQEIYYRMRMQNNSWAPQNANYSGTN